MKKIIAILLCLSMLFCFAACGNNNSETTDKDTTANADASTSAKSDLSYIKEKGKLVVGITVYEPMNYKDEDGKWTGFDTEFAELVAKELGVDAEFTVIDWDAKWETLKSKKIDVVWNGMTITDEAKSNAAVSNPYVINAQVVVMAADKLDTYKDKDSVKDLTFAVEAGSAGEDIAKDNGYEYKAYPAQSDALVAVKTAKQDACIIDITMANAMTGEDTDYASLGVGVSLTEEEYGIACRKNSDLVDEINKIMATLKENGKLKALAEKYSVTLAD